MGNRQGFSIVQSLIGIAVVSMASIGAASIGGMAGKIRSGMQGDRELFELDLYLRKIFENDRLCGQAFLDQSIDSPDIEIRSTVFENGRLKKDDQFGRKWQVVKLKLPEAQADEALVFGAVEVHVESKRVHLAREQGDTTSLQSTEMMNPYQELRYPTTLRVDPRSGDIVGCGSGLGGTEFVTPIPVHLDRGGTSGSYVASHDRRAAALGIESISSSLNRWVVVDLTGRIPPNARAVLIKARCGQISSYVAPFSHPDSVPPGSGMAEDQFACSAGWFQTTMGGLMPISLDESPRIKLWVVQSGSNWDVTLYVAGWSI